jgi:hypothetical protein
MEAQELNQEGMFYLLYAVQLKKVIVSTNIEKTVQEYNDPELEFELLGRTNSPEVAKDKAMEYYTKVQMHGTPHGDAFGNNAATTDFKFS